ncbi:hypothetical protein E0L93_12935 [Rubrobacter taiwanensis]|uniref:Uncharacterized protein n=1 Tax=Rubrobacter taiwanensis TaxID=185139 RepID=A0A4V6NB02_9ACTN|nr:hypothetical protein [Rubrobacter taiwanensis]TCJ15292.1 hypothetical protein E0L93_12935 [Rubrobacter taiwanensis]
MIFTGRYPERKPGEWLYLRASAAGDRELREGRPPYGRLGREIPFACLPQEVQAAARELYLELWGLRVSSPNGRTRRIG